MKIIYYISLCSMNTIFKFQKFVCVKDVFILFLSPCTSSGQSGATKGSTYCTPKMCYIKTIVFM